VLAIPELVQIVLPVLRADILVLEGHRHVDEPPIDVPISCFRGESDRHAYVHDFEAWRELTTGPFRHRSFPGGHFFIDSARAAVLRALGDDLAACIDVRGGQQPWS
jgi:medium-chain acyl-[acyl-carrier-protein] hydrolase